MKKLLTSFLIILLIFTSCKNPDLVEYIEKGFAKPAVEDVQFNESSLGNENKIYVPSNRDIEIELTIKNKYEKEITGTLEFAKDKKDLFGTAPYIKSLTATKMVVAFKFKEEAEPQATNDFLGASIPLNLKIYEKKTARFLSSQTIEANCNTAPLPIAKDKIVYNQEKDEYSVTLPKKTGKNNDLKNVEFSLSSMFSNEAVSSRIVPITEENEQNIKLKVKGEEDWQLKNPSGDRTLKAVVYDKAGLNSSSQNTSKRKFTSITLEPSSVGIDKASAIADGFSVPKIKELVDYFREEKNWIAAGYNVEYLTNDFERISSQTPQVFKPKDPGLLTAGNYEIVVKLSGGGNELTKKYPVAIMGSNEAGINTDKLKITDETTYKSSELKIEIGSLNFTNDGTDAKKCDVAIPYTDINTNLKVHVEALGEGTIRTSELDPNKAKKRDFNIELEKNSESEKTLIFYAYAPDNHTNIKYTIKFNRKASIYAAVALKNELLQSKNCTVKMIWKYGEKTIFTTDDGSAKNDGLRVATGESIKFEVTAGVGHKIKECSSNNHSPITIDNDKKLIFNLSANADFTLSVTFTAEASFKWIDIGKKDASDGYTKACASYSLNGVPKTKEYTSGTAEEAIEKGKECKFWIEGLVSTKHKVLLWEVNKRQIKNSESDGSITLNDDRTVLTIKNPTKDYEIKVWTQALYDLTLKVCDESGVAITGHGYTFEVRANYSGATPLTPASFGHYEGIANDTTLYITALPSANSEYDIVKWEKQKTNGTGYDELTGSEKNKRMFNLTSNTTIRLVLKKKTFNVSWKIDGADTSLDEDFKTKIEATVNTTPPQSITSGNEATVEIGGSVTLQIEQLEDGRLIDGWEVDKVLHKATNGAIKIENEKKKLTISNIKKDINIALKLKPETYTIKVEIVKPDKKAIEHTYKIKATRKIKVDGTETEFQPSETTSSLYTFSNVPYDSKSWKFEAFTEGYSPYYVEKWQYLWNGEFKDMEASRYVNSNDKKAIKWAPSGDVTFKVFLAFRLVKISVNETGNKNTSLSVKQSSNGHDLGEVPNGQFRQFGVVVETGKISFKFKVNNIVANQKIIYWKVNGKDDVKRFLKDDGYWKGEDGNWIGNFEFMAGDEVELNIAKLEKLKFILRDGGSEYSGSGKIFIKKTAGNKGVLLPFKETIEFNKGTGTPDSIIYAALGTQIDITVQLDDNTKKVTAFKYKSNDLDGTLRYEENKSIFEGLWINKPPFENEGATGNDIYIYVE